MRASVRSQQSANALLTRATLYLSAGATCASLPHTFDYCSSNVAQAWPLSIFTAALPEASVTLCVLRLTSGAGRYARLWAALYLATSVAFTVRANLGDVLTLGHWDGALIRVWPVWATIGAAGLLDHGARASEPAAVADDAPASEPAAGGALPPRTDDTERERPPDASAEMPAPDEVSEQRDTRARGREAEQLEILRSELPHCPDRTDEQWAERLGCSVRTYYRRKERLAEVRAA